MEIEIIMGIVLGACALLAGIIILWYIVTLNSFRKMCIKINESASSIDVALTKRYNVLAKMLAIYKNYAKNEQEALAKIIELRQPGPSSRIVDKSIFSSQMIEAMQELYFLSEKYPQLKANKTFAHLQKAAIEVEENLQAARRFYNGNVRIYNQKVALFPSNLVARQRGFKPEEFFEADEVKPQKEETKN